MTTKTKNIQRNKLMHLENTLFMYGVHNAEMLERLMKTVHKLPSRQTMYESLFTVRNQQHMNIIHKCMENEVYTIMQLIQCYI